MVLSIIIFVIIICTIVICHEFGHYIVAKKMGIGVRYFYIGFGPNIFSFKKWGTTFCVKWLPLGGACVFDDETTEDDDSLDKDEAALNNVDAPDKDEAALNNVDALDKENAEQNPASEGSFLKAGVWQRIATVFAGPMFNFILAFFLSIIIAATTYTDRPVIQGIIDGFPAQEAGIMVGDKIISLNGERVYLGREVSLFMGFNQGKPLDIVYEREGQRRSAHLVPKLDKDSDRYLYGFQGYIELFRANPLQVIQYSFYELRYSLLSTIKSFAMMFNGQVKPQEVSGVVGIAVLVDDVTKETMPYGVWATIVNLISMAALLSVNLGVLNLFPIPALDGGRLVFMFIEVLRGKPLPPEKESLVHLAGFVFIGILAVLVIFNDIHKLLM